MLRRYPAIRPYATYEIAVEAPHVIYVEESGSPDGIPVIVVHGGPGAGSNPEQRRFFDPNLYRIILFDQRGCGKSTPQGCLENNNTQALISDMEIIREHLDIDKWVLFGGSWGAALSLLYAQAHPDRVRAMILRSVLLADDADRRWFFEEGANRIFPAEWYDFAGTLPPSERKNVLEAYYNRLLDSNELVSMRAAKCWSQWHRRCSTINPVANQENNAAGTMRLARIESYYFINKCFIEDNQILDNMRLIKHIPAILVHGRYDMITPLDNSYRLQRAWPKSELTIVRDAGHASNEPALTDSIVQATDRMAKLLSDNHQPRGAG
ncbi:MAG: prolyl aminopeptidase [Gammaproteobacteria bacterium]|nr:prolyl aminopeptidase [Gammaproteobacteria bacterium]